MLKFSNKIIESLLAFLGIILLAVIGLSVWNVVSRYIFGEPILWADEVATFSIIIFTYVGVIISAWKGTDIRMDILTGLLPTGFQRLVHMLQHLMVIGLTGWIAWLSYGYVQRVYRVGMTSTAAEVPLWIVHALLPIGFLMVALISVIHLLRLITGRTDLNTAISSISEVTNK